MTTPTAALFFAAGFGTRMGPLTRSRPKPLICVGPTTLLDHALDLGHRHGLARRVVNTHYLAPMIADHLSGRDVLISDEQPDILETGGGLRRALPLLGPGPVFTMNTDAAWSGPNPFDLLEAAWEPRKMDALLLLIAPDRALGHPGAGDFLHAPTGQITRGPGLIYTGAQILRPDGLDTIDAPCFSLNRIWDRMLETGRIHGIPYPGHWCDVGRPEAIPLAASLLEGADVR